MMVSTVTRDALTPRAKACSYCIRLKVSPAAREDAWDLWGFAAQYGGVEVHDCCFVFRDHSRENGMALRSALEVKGYHIEGTDGEIGYVEDFIVDDEDWVLRYMIANTGSWWPGRSVLVAPQWVESIRWSERKVHVALTQANFKEAPAFDPSVRVNRQHEEHLYDFHGREHYWK